MESKRYIIDPEFSKVMEKLEGEDYKYLEESLLKDGFKGAPLMAWNGIIVDGHNRFTICQKYNIPFEVKELHFNSREDVVDWMIRTQLGRRNLTSAQRIALTEKYRPIYEKQALLNKQIAIQKANLENPKHDTNDSILPNVVKTNPIDTTKKLAEIAGVGKETYRQAKRVLDSTDEELKQRVLLGKKSISAGYKEINQKSDLQKGESNTEHIDAAKEVIPKSDKLTQIQKRYSDYLEQFKSDIEWLTSKEYEDSNGIDQTNRIQPRLASCFNIFEGIKMDMLRMKQADDENIVLTSIN